MVSTTAIIISSFRGIDFLRLLGVITARSNPNLFAISVPGDNQLSIASSLFEDCRAAVEALEDERSGGSEGSVGYSMANRDSWKDSSLPAEELSFGGTIYVEQGSVSITNWTSIQRSSAQIGGAIALFRGAKGTFTLGGSASADYLAGLRQQLSTLDGTSEDVSMFLLPESGIAGGAVYCGEESAALFRSLPAILPSTALSIGHGQRRAAEEQQRRTLLLEENSSYSVESVAEESGYNEETSLDESNFSDRNAFRFSGESTGSFSQVPMAEEREERTVFSPSSVEESVEEELPSRRERVPKEREWRPKPSFFASPKSGLEKEERVSCALPSSRVALSTRERAPFGCVVSGYAGFRQQRDRRKSELDDLFLATNNERLVVSEAFCVDAAVLPRRRSETPSPTPPPIGEEEAAKDTLSVESETEKAVESLLLFFWLGPALSLLSAVAVLLFAVALRRYCRRKRRLRRRFFDEDEESGERGDSEVFGEGEGEAERNRRTERRRRQRRGYVTVERNDESEEEEELLSFPTD